MGFNSTKVQCAIDRRNRAALVCRERVRFTPLDGSYWVRLLKSSFVQNAGVSHGHGQMRGPDRVSGPYARSGLQIEICPAPACLPAGRAQAVQRPPEISPPPGDESGPSPAQRAHPAKRWRASQSSPRWNAECVGRPPPSGVKAAACDAHVPPLSIEPMLLLVHCAFVCTSG